MNIDDMKAASTRARAQREGAYRKAADQVRAATNDAELERAELFLALAEAALTHAGEPIPSNSAAADASSAQTLAPPPAAIVPVLPSPAAVPGAGHPSQPPKLSREDEIEAAAQRILASDGPAEVAPSGNAEVDAIAARIAASDADPEADEADAIAARIAAA